MFDSLFASNIADHGLRLLDEKPQEFDTLRFELPAPRKLLWVALPLDWSAAKPLGITTARFKDELSAEPLGSSHGEHIVNSALRAIALRAGKETGHRVTYSKPKDGKVIVRVMRPAAKPNGIAPMRDDCH